MFLAENWKDYEVLDTSRGEKLERWGDYTLLRPDPQVIWNTEKKIPEWRKLNAHYHRSNKGGGEWEFFDLPKQWQIHYDLDVSPRADTSEAAGTSPSAAYITSINQTTQSNTDATKTSNATQSSSDDRASHVQLTFNLKPFSFKHTGLFPEQAANWDWFSKLIVQEKRKRLFTLGADPGEDVFRIAEAKLPPDQEIKVLNLFAYTGGATIAAAKAGAHVTHVDASKGMVQWAKENAKDSGVPEENTRWLVDDCKKFVEREIRRGNLYDAIIMDPPSYGRGPKGEVWKMEEAIYELLTLCNQILKQDALFFLLNSYTTGLQPGVLKYLLEAVIQPGRGGTVQADEVGLPVTASGSVLPCGAAGRWSSDI